MGLQLLNLLLEGVFSRNDWTQIDWKLLLKIAQRNLVLLRTGDLLQQKGISIPQFFLDAIDKEKKRIEAVDELIGKISKLCVIHKISFLMPTALQHLPDMGGDIDLLVPNDSRLIDSLLADEFQAKPLPRNLFNLISTESSFSLNPPYPSIEIHHGRLGLTGEHRFFAALLFKNSKVNSFHGVDIPIPSDEDHLLLQTIQRLYGRFYFRISDLVHPVRLIKNKDLDWDYLFKTTSEIGLREGWRFYLSYLNKIYNDLFAQSLVPPSVQRGLVKVKKESFVFKNAYYRYPMLAVTGKLYWKKWTADLLSRRLASLSRLCLLLPVACSFLVRNLRGNRSRYFQ